MMRMLDNYADLYIVYKSYSDKKTNVFDIERTNN